ncbi:UNVERIFIED_CONTAM: hypothetical protein K2H54_059935 [Gekko kuhli]
MVLWGYYFTYVQKFVTQPSLNSDSCNNDKPTHLTSPGDIIIDDWANHSEPSLAAITWAGCSKPSPAPAISVWASHTSSGATAANGQAGQAEPMVTAGARADSEP